MTTFPASQTARLDGLDFRAVAPSFVPKGFAVAEVHGTAGRRAGSPSSYRIVYAGPDGACFAVEGTRDGGFGGPVPARRRPFKAPLFAEQARRQHFVHWNERPVPGFPAPTLVTDWIEKDGAHYRLASGRHVSRSCRRIAPGAAARIAASLRLFDAITAPPKPPRLRTADAERLSVRPVPRPARTPRGMARRVLDGLGVALSDEQRASERAVEERVETYRPAPDTAQVLVTHTGGGGDSVAARRYLIELARTAKGDWRLLGAGRQVRCHQVRCHRIGRSIANPQSKIANRDHVPAE